MSLSQASEEMEDSSALDKLLDTIDASGGPSGADCANNAYQDVPVRLPTHIFDSLVQKIELVSRVLEGYFSHHDQSKFCDSRFSNMSMFLTFSQI